MRSLLKPKKLSYNLRIGPIPNLPRTQPTYYGTNAIHFRGSLIWNNHLAKVKSNNSVFEFKTKIENLGNVDYGCVICRQTSFTTIFDLILLQFNTFFFFAIY